jgi:hypothetical protein
MPKNGDMAPRAEKECRLTGRAERSGDAAKKNAPVLRQKNSAG